METAPWELAGLGTRTSKDMTLLGGSSCGRGSVDGGEGRGREGTLGRTPLSTPTLNTVLSGTPTPSQKWKVTCRSVVSVPSPRALALRVQA